MWKWYCNDIERKYRLNSTEKIENQGHKNKNVKVTLPNVRRKTIRSLKHLAYDY
jgi:hypothetical protein